MNTLHAIFDWLLVVSLRASLLTAVVFLLQAVLRRHLTARMRHALWLPVLVVLLMPVFPQSRWSVETVFTAPPQVQITTAPINFISSSQPLDLISPAVPTPIDWRRILFIAWLVGASGILLSGSLSFIITLRRFRRSRQPVSEELSATLAQIAREVRLRHVPRILISRTISSPAVTGLLRPTLLLPAEFGHAFTAVEARLVLKHELMHLKRHDLPLNAALCVLMALHWFNPLLWLAFFKARLDREAACDAQVLQNDSSDRRREYGHALLKVEAAFCPRGPSLGFVGIFQRGAALRSRIQSIATRRQPHVFMKAIFIVCIAGMTFFGVTRAQQPQSPNEDASLIAIEIKILEFKKPTEWDFDGKLKSVPEDGFSVVQLSPDELSSLMRGLLKHEDLNTTAYPRMVTLADKEVVIKSVINQPYENAKGEIAHLPVGFICNLTPSHQDGHIRMKTDVTDSEIVKYEPLVTRSSVFRSDLDFAPGHSNVIFGWNEGSPQSKRPLLYVITPRVIKPAEGGLPADVSLLSPAPAEDPALAINTKLQTIILPRVQFSGASIEEVIEYLRAKSREFDTVGKTGVQFILRAGDTKSGPISLDLTKVPLVDVLRYSTELAGLKYKVEPYAVTIAAEVPAKLEITAKETSYNKGTGILTAKGDARTQFGKMTIQANELVHDQKNQQLQMIAPFVLITEGTKQITSTDANAVAALDLKTGRLSIQGGHKTQVLEVMRADQIIIPSVQFREATLGESIDFIRIKAAQLDPGKKGVNIIVMPGAPAARITLDLKEIPVTEALRYISELGGCRLTTEGQTFIFTPVAAP